jgi:CRISPR system Cascade subunit CasB
MNGFIKWLEAINQKDNRVRAVLRRSLAFDPGKFAPAYPYVEPFVKNEDNSTRRQMCYLVAGLWATHWRSGRTGLGLSIGSACAVYQMASASTSTERRFINLLAADTDQLPYHLRQMVALLKDQTVDFEDMLKKLIAWNDEQKRSQNAWARDYYRNLIQETEINQHTEKEISE